MDEQHTGWTYKKKHLKHFNKALVITIWNKITVINLPDRWYFQFLVWLHFQPSATNRVLTPTESFPPHYLICDNIFAQLPISGINPFVSIITCFIICIVFLRVMVNMERIIILNISLSHITCSSLSSVSILVIYNHLLSLQFLPATKPFTLCLQSVELQILIVIIRIINYLYLTYIFSLSNQVNLSCYTKKLIIHILIIISINIGQTINEKVSGDKILLDYTVGIKIEPQKKNTISDRQWEFPEQIVFMKFKCTTDITGKQWHR